MRFYQVGSFAAGNRLLDDDQRSVQADPNRSNSLDSGHRACQGGGEALGARYALDAAMRATHGQLVAVNATGCLEVFSTPYPETSWRIPWLHSLFGNAPAVATGVAAAMKVKGRRDVRVQPHQAAYGDDHPDDAGERERQQHREAKQRIGQAAQQQTECGAEAKAAHGQRITVRNAGISHIVAVTASLRDRTPSCAPAHTRR